MSRRASLGGTKIRGCAGIEAKLVVIGERTAGQVGYVGEWHSHPDGAGIGMSPADGVPLATVAEEMRAVSRSPGDGYSLPAARASRMTISSSASISAPSRSTRSSNPLIRW